MSSDIRPPSQKKMPTLAQREARLGWLLVTPAVIIVLILVVFPVVWNMLLSLQRVRVRDLQTTNFLSLDISLDNFDRVIGVRDFWETLRTTLAYAFFGTVLSIVGGMWAALVVKKAFIGRSLVRGLMLFPYIAPVIAVTFLWRIMLNPQYGIVNEWIDGAGIERIDFLGRRSFELGIFGWTLTLPVALTSVIVFEAWRYFPFAFLFILARLQAMPSELEEAAMVDGATISQRFRYVTMPQMRGVLSVLFVLRFIWTFNKFDDIFLLTGGSAGTEVITVKIVDWLRGRDDIGSAAALSIVLAIVLLVLLAIYFKWF
ncbi:MAG: sugar ABC transporter permease [Acidimicrobiia bacterium]|nr:sugar ABC transporter permease [Acidimicrobiia bacterium]MDX2468426.1 sugar ABC transporter permease [Acidimicrobiia bacterium]